MPTTEQNRRPIVVVGCPRSGTTLLTTMLHAHPHVAMPPETRFPIAAYRRRESFGDLTQPDNRRALAHWVLDRHGNHTEDLGLDRALIVERIVDAAPTVGSAVAAVFQAYADGHGKQRWGEKRPAYWAEIDVILRLFPDAQLIHVIRDPRACVASLKQMPWWNRGVNGAITAWLLAQTRIRRDTRRLGADSYHEVVYEQLVADPRGVVTELCRYLEEEFDEAMLHGELAARQIVPRYKNWHERTLQPVDDSRTQAWRTELSAAEIGLVELVAARAMRRRGYQRSGLGTRPDVRRVARFGVVYLRRRAAIRRLRLQDARRRRRYRSPVAAQG